MFAVVLDGPKGRIYIDATEDMERLALSEKPKWKPTTKLPDNPRDFKTPNYGLNTYGELFTDRQLVALNTFSDLVKDAQAKATADAKAAGWEDDGKPLCEGGTGATAYGDALAVYLTFAVDKTTNRSSTICTFKSGVQCPGDTFGRQALPMSWDYAEANVLTGPSGSWESMVQNVVDGLLSDNSHKEFKGWGCQCDAQTQDISQGKVISTDPPYYDNIDYADLSDYFYVWMRKSLRSVYPDLFASMSVPKAEELVAAPYRHGGQEQAESFFLNGMSSAMHNLAIKADSTFPVTIYYAFKQSETNAEGTSSAGWETFLEAVIRSGFEITGTWPMRTERENRMIGHGTNALASSIVLVCRKRP